MSTLARRSPILDARGRHFARSVKRPVRARYDAAQTTSDNTRHWSWTDSFSADAANSPAVRKKLRERARYEVANNGWARSMVETLAHEVIGTGPRLQILTGSPDSDQWLERQFAAWSARVHLARKLRTMRKAKACDGEGIAILTNNRRLGDVQLDLRPIETEQLSTPGLGFNQNQIDGIDLDEGGEPVRYHVLKQHPGETDWAMDPAAEISPAPGPDEIIHIFRRDRPGQHRGIPELTPALPLFSRLRRYTLAVLAAAENIADITLALQTKQPDSADINIGPSGDSGTEPSEYETFDTFDLERNLVTVLPEDTQLFQPKPEQPSTTHADFLRATLAEAFAAVCMPYSVGAFDSSQENFASGKLTRQGFKRAVQVERALDWAPEVLRLFWTWLSEAKFQIPAQLRPALSNPSQWTVDVYWDGIEDIDPQKAAAARKTALESGQLSIPTLYAEAGMDYETEQEKQATALGLKLPEYRKLLAVKLLGVPGGGDQKAKGDDDAED